MTLNKQGKRTFAWAAGMLAAFASWTTLVCVCDVRAIGPEGSAVGLASVNGAFHALTGVHMALYTITDWLSLLPFAVAMGFAVLGLVQWVHRKALRRVDADLFVLGGFYAVMFGAYALFETVVINDRPILIDGVLEASYPSSTTMLVLCVMPTAMMQWRGRIRNRALRRCVMVTAALFTVFMVTARLLSGVHWLSDILGGMLLSAGLVLMYDALCRMVSAKAKNKGENGDELESGQAGMDDRRTDAV